MKRNKDLIISTKLSGSKLKEFLSSLENEGIKIVNASPDSVKKASKRLQVLHSSKDADYIVLSDSKTTPKIKDAKKKGKKIGMRLRITSNNDIDRLFEYARKGLDFVIVEVKDWKIIPLENIIAKLHKLNTRIFTVASNTSEVRKMFSILEVGVDGVIFSTDSIKKVREALVYLGSGSYELKTATITDIKEVGEGERSCVDTTSMLKLGEGMLVGSKSNFLFIVHNEAVGSSFTSARPFRVNAGAVHCYTITPDGTTKYLSELEGGSEVMIINKKGLVRRATVGRSKIERRPMLLVKATVEGDDSGSVIVQDAETIRFVKANGGLVSVTHLKKGDQILVHSKPSAGRHFGMEVSDEYIVEK